MTSFSSSKYRPHASHRNSLSDAYKPRRKQYKRAKTTARGLGTAHQRERKRLTPLVKSGRAFCSRCGYPIAPDAEWHLDHNEDRTGYLGPAHALCNLRAGAKKRWRGRARVRRLTARDW